MARLIWEVARTCAAGGRGAVCAGRVGKRQTLTLFSPSHRYSFPVSWHARFEGAGRGDRSLKSNPDHAEVDVGESSKQVQSVPRRTFARVAPAPAAVGSGGAALCGEWRYDLGMEYSCPVTAGYGRLLFVCVHRYRFRFCRPLLCRSKSGVHPYR
ncbi:hypothetical protein K523DRAFT_145217 [Schizophyllum commune Tattone D]|nr:hypothetical protein K523DRAFT_145217 [Schizophyllum commune Tattone D]